MIYLRHLLLIFAGLALSSISIGQVNPQDSNLTFPMLHAGYGFQIPYGDLKSRFGVSNVVGGGGIIQHKTGFFFRAEYYFMFGNRVKENTILENVSTVDGNQLSRQGIAADVFLYQRGFDTRGMLGYLFTAGPNPNSGFTAALGAGLLQHRIHIQNLANTAPYILNDYEKGYDRLTNGLNLIAEGGYRLMSDSRLVNVFIGAEFQTAYTRNRRSWNFDERKKDDALRIDQLLTFKVRWIVPLYQKASNEFYYED